MSRYERNHTEVEHFPSGGLLITIWTEYAEPSRTWVMRPAGKGVLVPFGFHLSANECSYMRAK